jgi:phosphomannomutase/predicted metal-dependent phosphoesterase TrpH
MELADETGVGTLSISDHNIQDWLEVLREAERLQREKGVVVDIVPGVELSLQVRNHIADFPGEIHLRLACVDVTNPNLQKIVEEVRLAHLAGIRAAADFFFSATDWQDLRDRIFAGLTTTLTDEDHQNIYETIIKNWQEKLSPEQREAIIKEGGRLDNFAEAILGTKEDHPYYRPIREFAKRFAGNQLNDAVEVLKQIRKIDPHASIILCHIWRYTKDEETAHKLVELLANEGLIDAMETDYSSFTADEKKAARRLADNHGLKYSGGSDSHRIDKEGETDGTLGSGYRDNIKIRTDEMVNWMRQKASEDYLRQGIQKANAFITDITAQDYDGIFTKGLQQQFQEVIADLERASVVFQWGTDEPFIPYHPYNDVAYQKLSELYQAASDKVTVLPAAGQAAGTTGIAGSIGTPEQLEALQKLNGLYKERGIVLLAATVATPRYQADYYGINSGRYDVTEVFSELLPKHKVNPQLLVDVAGADFINRESKVVMDLKALSDFLPDDYFGLSPQERKIHIEKLLPLAKYRVQATDGFRRPVAILDSEDPDVLCPKNVKEQCFSYAQERRKSLEEAGKIEKGGRFKIVLGFDPRDPEPEKKIVNAAIKGITLVGADVILVDISSTPATALYMVYEEADGAVMLTASHNRGCEPGDKFLGQNGIKLFLDIQGLKLFPEDEYKLTAQYYLVHGQDLNAIAENEGWQKGGVEDAGGKALEKMVEFMRDDPRNSWAMKPDGTPEERPFDEHTKIIVDCGKGANSSRQIVDEEGRILKPIEGLGMVAQYFKDLGAYVEEPIECRDSGLGYVNYKSGAAFLEINFEGKKEGKIRYSDVFGEIGKLRGFKAIERLFELGRANHNAIQQGLMRVIGIFIDADGDRYIRLDYDPWDNVLVISTGDEVAYHQARYLVDREISPFVVREKVYNEAGKFEDEKGNFNFAPVRVIVRDDIGNVILTREGESIRVALCPRSEGGKPLINPETRQEVLGENGRPIYLIAYDENDEPLIGQWIPIQDLRAEFRNNFIPVFSGAKFIFTVESDLSGIRFAIDELKMDGDMRAVGDKWLMLQAALEYMADYVEALKEKVEDHKGYTAEFRKKITNIEEDLVRLGRKAKKGQENIERIAISAQRIIELTRKIDDLVEDIAGKTGLDGEEIRVAINEEMCIPGRLRFTIGTEESGHPVTGMYVVTKTGRKMMVNFVNAFKSAVNDVIATTLLYPILKEDQHPRLSHREREDYARAYLSFVADPFSKGHKENYAVYYTRKALLRKDSPLFCEFKELWKDQIKAMFKAEGRDVDVVEVPKDEEPDMLFLEIIEQDERTGKWKTVASAFCRNSGTEAKTTVYVRGRRDDETILNMIINFGRDYISRMMKDRNSLETMAQSAMVHILSTEETVHREELIRRLCQENPEFEGINLKEVIEQSQQKEDILNAITFSDPLIRLSPQIDVDTYQVEGEESELESMVQSAIVRILGRQQTKAMRQEELIGILCQENKDFNPTDVRRLIVLYLDREIISIDPLLSLGPRGNWFLKEFGRDYFVRKYMSIIADDLNAVNIEPEDVTIVIKEVDEPTSRSSFNRRTSTLTVYINSSPRAPMSLREQISFALYNCIIATPARIAAAQRQQIAWKELWDGTRKMPDVYGVTVKGSVDDRIGAVEELMGCLALEALANQLPPDRGGLFETHEGERLDTSVDGEPIPYGHLRVVGPNVAVSVEQPNYVAGDLAGIMHFQSMLETKIRSIIDDRIEEEKRPNLDEADRKELTSQACQRLNIFTILNAGRWTEEAELSHGPQGNNATLPLPTGYSFIAALMQESAMLTDYEGKFSLLDFIDSWKPGDKTDSDDIGINLISACDRLSLVTNPNFFKRLQECGREYGLVMAGDIVNVDNLTDEIVRAFGWLIVDKDNKVVDVVSYPRTKNDLKDRFKSAPEGCRVATSWHLLGISQDKSMGMSENYGQRYYKDMGFIAYLAEAVLTPAEQVWKNKKIYEGKGEKYTQEEWDQIWIVAHKLFPEGVGFTDTGMEARRDAIFFDMGSVPTAFSVMKAFGEDSDFGELLRTKFGLEKYYIDVPEGGKALVVNSPVDLSKVEVLAGAVLINSLPAPGSKIAGVVIDVVAGKMDVDKTSCCYDIFRPEEEILPIYTQGYKLAVEWRLQGQEKPVLAVTDTRTNIWEEGRHTQRLSSCSYSLVELVTKFDAETTLQVRQQRREYLSEAITSSAAATGKNAPMFDSNLIGRVVVVVDTDELSLQIARNDLIAKGLEPQNVVPIIVSDLDINAIRFGALGVLERLRQKVERLVPGQHINLMIINASQLQDLTKVIVNSLSGFSIAIIEGPDWQNNWGDIYQSL